MKGCDENGYPLEGVNVVPGHKGKRKLLYSKEQDFCAGKIELIHPSSKHGSGESYGSSASTCNSIISVFNNPCL